MNLDAAVFSEIQTKLDGIAAKEGVTIPLAIESGSRAWGFPSPDSDYDCRFIYLRTSKENIALFPKRDVIELPLTPVFDVNGWDLRKAIKLLLKGNAVVVEWLQSPIAYREDKSFRRRLLALAHEVAQREAVWLHYHHLLHSTLRRHVNEGEPVAVKKLFYVLRPAMALRQLRLNPKLQFPSMRLQEVMEFCDLPVQFRKLVEDLVDRKAVTRELGREMAPQEIIDFVLRESEFKLELKNRPERSKPERVGLAEACFSEMQRKWAPDREAQFG